MTDQPRHPLPQRVVTARGAMQCAAAILGAGVLALGPAQTAAQDRAPGSWVIIQGEPPYQSGIECALPEPPADTASPAQPTPCSTAKIASPLKFRLDLLPEIHATAAEERRRLEMYEARRRALAARHVKPPLLSAHGDMPLTYSFAVEEKGLDSRYTRDTLKAQGNVAVAGYKVEASLAETSHAMRSGANRISSVRAEAPVAFGPVALRAGVNTYSVRDTTAGAAATKVGYGADARISAALGRNLDAEFLGKVEHVRDGSARTVARGATTLHYRFPVDGLGLGQWQGKLSPGVEVSQAVGDTPADMAVRMGVSLVNGPQKVELSQRVHRQVLAGAASADDQETVLDYRYNWPRSSISLRGSRATSGKADEASGNWQLGAVWTLKLEALADYFP
ncbi:hypothetical protein [Rhodoligotrophos defluvii]|uniref:hypothetical protein n=1 Tax=Rhodoligotrophos defluvii TaxID=2561934 RepID=UPI0010C9E15E|nr:hypothetical protein [Rhodoligotrophos defluvii]